MFIGLLSDTHGVFSPEFREFLSPVDEIWHAGDFGGGLALAATIAGFKPLIGVSGNCDDRILIYDYPEYRVWDCEGKKILMTHIGGSPGHYYPRALALIRQFGPDVFVCGHSHILKVMHDPDHDLLYLNPGAAGLQGWHQVRTALRFVIDGTGIHDMEVYNLPRK